MLAVWRRVQVVVPQVAPFDAKSSPPAISSVADISALQRPTVPDFGLWRGSGMGEMVTRTWDGTSIAFQHQGAYAAYLPAPVAGWRPSFPTETENAASRASIELMRYQFECTDSAATDWVVYHAEGMASSTMEGCMPRCGEWRKQSACQGCEVLRSMMTSQPQPMFRSRLKRSD